MTHAFCVQASMDLTIKLDSRVLYIGSEEQTSVDDFPTLYSGEGTVCLCFGDGSYMVDWDDGAAAEEDGDDLVLVEAVAQWMKEA